MEKNPNQAFVLNVTASNKCFICNPVVDYTHLISLFLPSFEIFGAPAVNTPGIDKEAITYSSLVRTIFFVCPSIRPSAVGFS